MVREETTARLICGKCLIKVRSEIAIIAKLLIKKSLLHFMPAGGAAPRDAGQAVLPGLCM
jgi:hypothetical protein